MLAIIAAICFLIALVLDIVEVAGDFASTLVIAGLFFVALHLAGFLTGRFGRSSL